MATDTTDTTDYTAGFRCPLCGVDASETNVSLHLDYCEMFHCHECDEDFGEKEINAQIAAGQRMLAMARAARAAAEQYTPTEATTESKA